MQKRDRTHDEVRDHIAREYFSLPPISCRFCKYDRPIVTKEVAQVVTERGGRQFRADIAALNQQGEIIAVVEVINTNPPKEQKLAAQSELASAFYVTLDALDDGFTGYCSPFCWTNRKEENVSPLDWDLWICGDCKQPFHTLEWTYRLVNWEDPNDYVCIECAARTQGGQWRTPGELAMGDPRNRIPDPDANVLDLFLSFSDADFWAMVWTERTAKPNKARTPETATALRLDEVEAAFDSGDWNAGERLLQPIGAPAWDRPPGPALFAWDHDNRARVASAWRRLREYRISCLPSSLQAAIGSRPLMVEVVSDVVKTTLIHRGFPDGQFTACGIDREKSDEPIEMTMKGAITCNACR